MLAAKAPADVPEATGCASVDSPYAAVGPYWNEAVPASGSGFVALPNSVADVVAIALAAPVTAAPVAAS